MADMKCNVCGSVVMTCKIDGFKITLNVEGEGHEFETSFSLMPEDDCPITQGIFTEAGKHLVYSAVRKLFDGHGFLKKPENVI